MASVSGETSSQRKCHIIHTSTHRDPHDPTHIHAHTRAHARTHTYIHIPQRRTSASMDGHVRRCTHVHALASPATLKERTHCRQQCMSWCPSESNVHKLALSQL